MAMSSGAGGDAGPRGRRRAVDAEPVDSRIAQDEIRVVVEAVVVVFWVCRLSALWSYFYARQRRKDSRVTWTRVFGTSFGRSNGCLGCPGLAGARGDNLAVDSAS